MFSIENRWFVKSHQSPYGVVLIVKPLLCCCVVIDCQVWLYLLPKGLFL